MSVTRIAPMRRDHTVETLSWRLAKPQAWTRNHAELIPGAYKLGRHWRFDAERVEEWIASGADLGSQR